jgi:hypothetical protein
MQKSKMLRGFWWRSLNVLEHLEDQGIEANFLKLLLGHDGRTGTGFIWLRIGMLQYGNELSGFHNCAEFVKCHRSY